MSIMEKPRCDIIIPIWNQYIFTKRCIESIRRSTQVPYRLILIDNKSDKETKDYLMDVARKNDSTILIRNKENLGFIKAANQGLKISSAPFVCLMNNDTIATEGWLGNMMSLAESDPVIGLVNPRSEPPVGLSRENYAKRLAKDKGQYIETNQCMGFCMLIKRVVIEKIGYLDEIYGMGGFDDTDFSKRAHLAGYKCVCAKGAYVYHDWHTSFKKAGNREELVKKNEELFFNKWGRYLRIGYPISYNQKENFYTDINTSLGLAREWSWVHAWLNANRLLKRDLHLLSLPEHQSLRLFTMSGITVIFYLQVLFKLIERRFKGKKPFDIVLVSDKKLLKFLSLFKYLFSFPIFYVEKDRTQFNKDIKDEEELWRSRARDIIKEIPRRKAGPPQAEK